MRRKILTVLISVLGSMAFLLLFYYVGKSKKNTGSFLSRHAAYFFDYSKINVRSNLIDMDPDSLTIVQQGNGIIFRDGNKEKRLKNRYGTNCFIIWENRKVLCEICFFKKNYWYIDNYTFTVDTFEKEPFVDIDLNGPDSIENITYKKFNPLKNRTEVKYIDRNKTVYHIDTIPNDSPLLPRRYRK